MPSLRNLFVNVGVNVSGQSSLGKLNVVIKEAKERTLGLADGLKAVSRAFAAVAGAVAVGKIAGAFAELIQEQIASADALDHNAERLGITTEELQKFQYAAEMTGISADKLAVGVRYFNRSVGEAAIGTKSGVKTFTALGMHIRDAGGDVRPTIDLLFEFADALKKIPSQAERSTAYEMRIMGRTGSALLPMLQKGAQGAKSRFSKTSTNSGVARISAFIETAHQTDVSLKRLKVRMADA